MIDILERVSEVFVVDSIRIYFISIDIQNNFLPFPITSIFNSDGSRKRTRTKIPAII